MELPTELFSAICRRYGTDAAGGFRALPIARDWFRRGSPEESEAEFEDICSRYGTDPAGVKDALQLAWDLLQNGSPEESDAVDDQSSGNASDNRKTARWICSRITDYFDSSVGKNNIYTYSKEIGELPDKERAQVYKGITDHCIRYYNDRMKRDDDSCLLVTTTIMVDLYRTMNRVTHFNWKQQEYLEATAAALFAQMRSDGILVHFFTDNTFDNPEAVLLLFPSFLKACGFECVDAYSAAAYLADYKYHIKKTNEIYSAIPDILRTEQQTIEQMLNERIGDLIDEGKSFVLIAPFPHGTALKNLEKSIEYPGVITLYKREEPESGKITQFPFRRL